MLKKFCKPGEVIFQEGDESTEAYWIVSGRVEIAIRSGSTGLPVARLGPGEIVGEMGLIDNKPRAATATSLGITELEIITEEAFEKDVLEQPSRLRSYLSMLFERLRATDTLLELERARHPNAPLPVAAGLPPLTGEETSSEPVVSLKSDLPNPITSEIITAVVDRFPFRIGRTGGKWSPFFQNELSIPDENPLQVSRQHVSIESAGGKCYISDRGSRKGTVVNGIPLGVDTGTMIAELKPGANTVIFGQASTSRHHYSITVSPAH